MRRIISHQLEAGSLKVVSLRTTVECRHLSSSAVASLCTDGETLLLCMVPMLVLTHSPFQSWIKCVEMSFFIIIHFKNLQFLLILRFCNV